MKKSATTRMSARIHESVAIKELDRLYLPTEIFALTPNYVRIISQALKEYEPEAWESAARDYLLEQFK